MKKDLAIPKPKKMGRPTKYDPKYCDDIVFFFEREPNYEKQLEHFDDKGNLKWMDYKLMPSKFPTFLEYAKKIGVSMDALQDWANKYPDFGGAYKKAKELQKWFLIENGLAGLYNPTFAIFTAKNITDMRDQPTSLTQINVGGSIGFTRGNEEISK